MRGLVAVAITVVAALSLAPAGRAALVVRDDVDSADVTFTADLGEANRVIVREEPGGFRFVDAGSVLRTSTCTQVNAHEVFCPGIAETLIVEVGDGDDSVDVSGASIALVDGGSGADVLVAAFAAGGEGADVLRGIGVGGRLRGGPGDDTIVGGPGNDILAVDGGRDRLDGGSGNDSYVVDAGARGVAGTIADTGGDARDSISLSCKGARLLSASGGVRERRGRYSLAEWRCDLRRSRRRAALRAPEGRRADARPGPSGARHRGLPRRQGHRTALAQGPARQGDLAAPCRVDGLPRRELGHRRLRLESSRSAA